MKRFTLLNIIMLVIFIIFISIPASAGNIQVKDNNVSVGGTNTGIQGNKNHHNTIIGGDLIKGTNAGGSIKNTNKNNNNNLNCNKNVNKNTNIQGQVQGQSQSAHNEGVKQDVVFNQTIEAAETKRDHHTGTAVTFASLGSYSESAKTSSRFQTTKTMTMFKDTFSYESAKKRYWKGACKTIGSGYNGVHKDNPSKEVKIYDLSDKIIPGSVKSTGFLTILAEEGEGVSSFIVMQRAIILTAERQGDAFIVTKEGEETVTKSSGWGVGFNTSGSVINDMDNRGRSAAASGGTGYSSGKGSLERLPWMKIQILKYTN